MIKVCSIIKNGETKKKSSINLISVKGIFELFENDEDMENCLTFTKLDEKSFILNVNVTDYNKDKLKNVIGEIEGISSVSFKSDMNSTSKIVTKIVNKKKQ